MRTVLRSTLETFLHLSACLCQQEICASADLGNDDIAKLDYWLNASLIYLCYINGELQLCSYLSFLRSKHTLQLLRHQALLTQTGTCWNSSYRAQRLWRYTQGKATFLCQSYDVRNCCTGFLNNAGRQQDPTGIALVDFLELIRTLLQRGGIISTLLELFPSRLLVKKREVTPHERVW